MKRRFYKKLSLYFCLVLLFCCLPFRVVYASSVQDQSKPIFGLSADDVVEKYNQLSDSQKDQVLRSLGNTSIFANSLFGNIFNSSFGLLDDAVTKIGDLFFQANGVIYKLGSSALAWVSRLIDKVFNNDLNDLNISQPVIDDLYINTRGLVYIEMPFFVQPHTLGFIPNYAYNYIYPLPYSDYDYFYFNPNSNSVRLGFLYLRKTNVLSFSTGLRTDGLVVNVDSGFVSFGSLVYNLDNQNRMIFSSFSDYSYYDYSILINKDTSTLSWSPYIPSSSNLYIPRIGFSGVDYVDSLSTYLNSYFISASFYYLVAGGYITKVYLTNDSVDYYLTNNTYYNYIYDIPDQTPLNVTNIVSNTAINYDPIENIAYYLPDQYNIEQNFTVVDNYFISSGSAISGQAIDVNLVSPSVIDVRVINPEDISNQVHNEVNRNIINNNNVNFGDLNISVSVDSAVSQSSDILNDNIDTSENSPLGFMVAGVPPDLLTIFGAFVVACLVCALCERVFR